MKTITFNIGNFSSENLLKCEYVVAVKISVIQSIQNFYLNHSSLLLFWYFFSSYFTDRLWYTKDRSGYTRMVFIVQETKMKWFFFVNNNNVDAMGKGNLSAWQTLHNWNVEWNRAECNARKRCTSGEIMFVLIYVGELR